MDISSVVNKSVAPILEVVDGNQEKVLEVVRSLHTGCVAAEETLGFQKNSNVGKSIFSDTKSFLADVIKKANENSLSYAMREVPKDYSSSPNKVIALSFLLGVSGGYLAEKIKSSQK